MRTLADSGSVRISSLLSEGSERRLADDVLDGLTRPFKELPPKHFYDSRGSELFDQITELPEYYPTRAERAILEERAVELVQSTGAGELVELGSGSAEKARVLLDAMAAAGTLRRYVAMDVSEQVLRQAADELTAAYDGLEFEGLVGDFERHLESIPAGESGPRIVALLGGTIGNFLPGTRRRLLREIAGLLGPEDRFLLGTDLVKDTSTLEAAYNDSAGITGEFNRNVLRVINRELEADFVPEEFAHVAFFDREHEWIEMRLRSRGVQTVEIRRLGMTVSFQAGEEMRTEISAKFTRSRVESEFSAAGLALEGFYTDSAGRFALSLAGPAS